MAVGVVLVDPLHHIGLTFTWRIEGARSLSNREARLEHRLDAISIRGDVPQPTATSVPGCQVFKQVRELHGRPLSEVAVGPLIGFAGQGLQIRDDARAHIRLQGAGEAEEELSMGRDRLREGKIRRQRQSARQALTPIEPAPGEASADTRHGEQAARSVTSRPENGVHAFHDIREQITAQDHGHIVLLQTHRSKASRGLITGERHSFLDGIHSMAL